MADQSSGLIVIRWINKVPHLHPHHQIQKLTKVFPEEMSPNLVFANERFCDRDILIICHESHRYNIEEQLSLLELAKVKELTQFIQDDRPLQSLSNGRRHATDLDFQKFYKHVCVSANCLCAVSGRVPYLCF